MRMTLKLSQIRLYQNNPRLPESYNEKDALNKMVANQQRKLVLLARDIVVFGLSDVDTIAVFPDSEEGFYRVAEGNRRITALKLLQNPSLIVDEFPGISKEFQDIKTDSMDFDRIEVYAFTSEDDPRLSHFMELRHLGEREGVGTVKWNSKQKDRFDYRMNGKENLSIFLDKLEQDGILTAAQIDAVTKTNWERILRPVGLAFLGLEKYGRTYNIVDENVEEFRIKIQIVAKALAGSTVAKVYDNDKIIEFFEDMEKEYFKQMDHGLDAAQKGCAHIPEDNSSPRPANTESEDHKAKNSAPKDSLEIPRKVIKMPRDIFENCKTVIPSNYRLQSRNHRITQVIRELKCLEVEKYPNACGSLLRALIELSAKEYLEHNKIDDDATPIEFQPAICKACNHLVGCKKMASSLSDSIKLETNKGGVRNLFNGYMHNTDVYPSAHTIQQIFLLFMEFIRQCLL